MELDYKGCMVTIITAEKNVTFSIFFGETNIYKDKKAISAIDAIAQAKSLIDEFTRGLPRALSYKH